MERNIDQYLTNIFLLVMHLSPCICSLCFLLLNWLFTFHLTLCALNGRVTLRRNQRNFHCNKQVGKTIWSFQFNYSNFFCILSAKTASHSCTGLNKSKQITWFEYLTCSVLPVDFHWCALWAHFLPATTDLLWTIRPYEIQKFKIKICSLKKQ